MKEFDFLNIISKNLSDSSFLGDDCACLKDYNLVLSTDTLVEDVHFSFRYMTIADVAKKALAVNVSDILASGAKPNYALISLSGKLDSEFIDEFYLALNEETQKYNLKIIGGDLTGGNKISITVTILGDTKNRNISKRSSAKIGYIIGVTGSFGYSKKGLDDIQKGLENKYTKFHKYPILYPKISDFIGLNTKNPYAMMDASDGLFDCLYQISSKSKVKASIEYKKIPTDIEDKNTVLFGGEDYSLVFAMEKDDFLNLKENFKQEVFEIGIIQEGTGVFADNIEIKENKSFRHFE